MLLLPKGYITKPADTPGEILQQILQSACRTPKRKCAKETDALCQINKMAAQLILSQRQEFFTALSALWRGASASHPGPHIPRHT